MAPHVERSGLWTTVSVMKFANFTVNASAGELRRDGQRVKIQDLPLRVLVVLLSRAGELVTRDQLRSELWGAETFVDAEAGLNTAIAKLREALGDSADQPRFIETLPKRGYRFKAQPTLPVEPNAAGTATLQRPGRASRKVGRTVIVLAVLAAAVFGVWKLWLQPRPVTIAVVLFHNETGDTAYDQLAQQLTDGTVVALAASPQYSVIGNAAILRTPRIFADIQKIGEALHADYLVLGQVQRVDGNLIVRAHFIRARDQTHLWASGIPGDPSGLDSLVPQTVADAVDRVLTPVPK